MNTASQPESRPDIERLVGAYGTALLRIAFLYLKDDHLAEDAVQETFLKAYRTHQRFRGQSSEKTWLTSILINTCKDMLKSAWRRHTDLSATMDEAALPTTGDAEPDENTQLLQFVMRLPPKLMDVVILFYYQDASVKETAAALNLSQGAVRVRLNRARAELKKALNEKGVHHALQPIENSH